ncbi:MAG: peptide chain release factor 3, partial [Pseudomonadota bacterium]
AAKAFKPEIASGWIVGVVGQLQFEVLASRIEQEYDLPVRFEPTQYTSARWVRGEREEVEAFVAANRGQMATDNDGDPVFLTRIQWDIDRASKDFPNVTLATTKETMV